MRRPVSLLRIGCTVVLGKRWCVRERICSGNKTRPGCPPDVPARTEKLSPAAKHLPRATSEGPGSLPRTCPDREPVFVFVLFFHKEAPDLLSHAAAPLSATLGNSSVGTRSHHRSQLQEGSCLALSSKKQENKNEEEEKALPDGSTTELL